MPSSVLSRMFLFYRRYRYSGRTSAVSGALPPAGIAAAQVVGVRYEELREDDLVRYTQEDDPHGKGPIATNVARIKRAPAAGAVAHLPEPEEPAPGRWPLAAGRAVDDEDDNTYDWSQAG